MNTPRVDATRAGRRQVRLWRATTLGLLLGLLGGCAGTAEDRTPRPELVWLDGEPVGDLESDEWVRAAREADFAHAWAHNVADFSLPTMAATWDNFSIERFAWRLEGDLLHERARVYLGPRPMTPVLVQVDDDGKGAMVAACIGAYETQPPYDDGNSWPQVGYYLLELTADGQRRMTGGHHPERPLVLPDGTELTAEYCNAVTIPRAVFDPEPDLDALARKGKDDVVFPTHAPTR